MSECPICTADLKVQGDAIRSLGTRSDTPIAFGQEVISLECGHRLHRSCLISWLTIGQSPTCPMCRYQTEWVPDVHEERSIVRMIGQSWKSLGAREHSFIKLIWILAAVISISDPIGFTIFTSIILTLLPPFLFPQLIIIFAFVRSRFVSNEPGVRLSMSFAIASLLSVLTIANHELSRRTEV